MKRINDEWKENYQKIRNQILIKVLTMLGGIISLSTYIYNTIILQTIPGELLPSQTAVMLLSVAILVAATIVLYTSSMSISKTYRDEGMDIKVNKYSDVTLMLFYSKMDQCFKNTVRLSSTLVMLFAIMIYIALLQAYSFSTAVIFTGVYLIALLMTFPNICQTQARKKTYVERYHPEMTFLDMKDLVYDIAMSSKGKTVCSKTKRVIETNLSNFVEKSKKRFRLWIYAYTLSYIFNAITYATIQTDTLLLFGYLTVSKNSYYTILSLIIISFLFGQRYLYAQVSSGDALKRRRISRTIIGHYN